MGQNDGDATAIGADWLPITEIFAAHARRVPDALAVKAQGRRLSYAELAQRVDLFAARLTERLPDRASGRGLLIGICLDRDVDLPAWLFAVMKVGGAYLPIDPTTPLARLAQIVEDAEPALILASRCNASTVAGVGVQVMIVEEEPTVAPRPAAAVAVRPDDLAYVIFTSGSTGRPKGVEIEHRSLEALMATMAVCPGLAAGEQMIGITRISFDLSVPDLFLPFYVGGSLALVDAAVAADPGQLAAAFEAHRPDLAQATPSTWRALIEGGWNGQPDLRIVAGGEAMTRALADRLLPRCGELWNIYGPTETTVWSTAARVEPGEAPVPIGRPLTGYRIHVADPHGTPLPDGEVGEIIIGGVGVARGYRNRPDLTAERFVLQPDGSRAYRTGDLGRIDSAGALFCLGRLDDQVKVRGFRIELGDVEAALALHPAVAWAAVRLWTDASGEPTLAAYVVPRSDPAPTVRDLKGFLATQVAPYMVPDRVLLLSLMPLTPNGKVDRACLPSPFGVAARPQATATATVSRLASIWAELLGVSEVRSDDDFFDLGGYSLMTVRLARRVEAEFGVKLSLVDLLRHSTLAAMVARIDRGNEHAGSDAMLLNMGGGRPPLFWLDAGPLMRTMARGLSPDQPAYALNLDPSDEEALGAGDLSIYEVADTLKAKLLAQQPQGPFYLGGWCRWGIVAFELAQQLIEDGEDVALLAMLDAECPGAVTRSSALRTRLSRLLRKPSGNLNGEPASFSQRVEIASKQYAPRRYHGDVLLLRPQGSRDDGGWGTVVKGVLSVQLTPGDHVSMVREPAVRMLSLTLDGALRAAQRKFAAAKSQPAQATHASL